MHKSLSLRKRLIFVGNRGMNARFSSFLDKRDTFSVLHGYIRMYLCIIIAEYQHVCKDKKEEI